MESDWSTGVFVGVDPRISEALIISIEGLFRCGTVRRVIREEALSEKLLDEALRRSQQRLEGHSAQDEPGLHIKTSTTLDTRVTEGCRGCEFLQTGIGQRQNHSDQCRDRLEVELAKSEKGQVRLERSKDRIDHWAAKVGEDVLAEGSGREQWRARKVKQTS